LDESFRKPELLAAILFSAYFILIPNTTGNSLAFSKNLLLAANPTATVTGDLDGRLLTFFAVCGLSMVCFLHYFSRRSGMFLNKLFALYKIFLLIAFIVAGGIASRSDGNGKDDWSSQPGNRDYLGALIYVMYSYRGWENANYVCFAKISL
jgi:amino acid transporter